MTAVAHDELPSRDRTVRGLVDARVLTALAAYFLVYIVVIGLSFYQQGLLSGVVPYDGVSYLSHSMTLGLDGDLDYRNEASVLLAEGRMNPSGTAPPHPMGPGILAAPFVAAFSLIDRANGHPVVTDRTAYVGSWSYFGMQFATVFYFLAGIALYQIALRRWVSPFIVAVAVVSAGLLYYVTQQFAFGHAYEFFTLALLTATCLGLCHTNEQWQIGALVVAIGASIFLALMTRWVNYGALAVPLLTIMTHYLIERQGRYRRALLLSYAGVVGGLAAVALFHLWAFGIVWPTPEYFYGSTLKVPDGLALPLVAIERLANVPLLLFSSEFGLIWTFPVLPMAAVAAAFLFLRHVRKDMSWALWAAAFTWCVGVPLVIVLLWQTTASAYGYRFLLPAMPAALLGMALFLNARILDERYGRDGAWAAGVLPLTLLFLYFLGFVSFLAQMGFDKLDGFTIYPQVNVFGVEHTTSARGYMDAVFGAIARPSQWLEVIRHSLFVRVVTPTAQMRAMPQLVDQFRILLLVIPLIGAVLSAGAYAHDWPRFAATSALVGLAALLLWLVAVRAIDVRERPREIGALGTPSADLLWLVGRPCKGGLWPPPSELVDRLHEGSRPHAPSCSKPATRSGWATQLAGYKLPIISTEPWAPLRSPGV
jgi:hypothetical protein